MVKYKMLEQYIDKRLRDNLAQHFKYHNVQHTHDVVTRVEEYAKTEGVSEYETLMLKTAALFHDLGLLESFDEHEKKSAEFARNILPDFGCEADHIETIMRLIMATEIDHQPLDVLEAIIKDADTDNLGREDYFDVSDRLFEELHYFTGISRKDWQQQQLRFIENHQYYCSAAKEKRNKGKNANLKKLKEIMRKEN